MTNILFLPEYISNYFDYSGSFDHYSSSNKKLPSTYLDYARADQSEGNDPRCLINAIGNAKRAFHLQTEMLCDAFGWEAIYAKKRSHFGVRLEYLQKCGVLSPNILKKLNRTRNFVEHEYIEPSNEEVDDYLTLLNYF